MRRLYVVDINKTEAVQRYFMKRLGGLGHICRIVTLRLSVLELISLHLRRIKADLLLCYKMINNLVDDVMYNCLCLQMYCIAYRCTVAFRSIKLHYWCPAKKMQSLVIIFRRRRSFLPLRHRGTATQMQSYGKQFSSAWIHIKR